jgi:hypothetical protein
VENTFRSFRVKFVTSQSFKNGADMAFVLSFIFRVYKNIIEIDNITNIDKTYQCFINIDLESRRRVRKPERHNDVFVMPVTGAERRLLFVAFANSDAVIRIPKVEFGKYSDPAQAV